MDDPEPLRSLDIPRPLPADSLSCVAEDASTLNAAQEQEQQPRSIHERASSDNAVDAQSLPSFPLISAGLDPYTAQQLDGNGARLSRTAEPYNSLVRISAFFYFLFCRRQSPYSSA